MVDELEAKAERDCAGEGYDPTMATRAQLALDMKYGGQIHIHRAQSPRLRITTEEDVRAIYESFEPSTPRSSARSTSSRRGASRSTTSCVRVAMPDPAWTLRGALRARGRPTTPRIGRRPVLWDELGARVDTESTTRPSSGAGQWLDGPAMVEARVHDDRRRPGLPRSKPTRTSTWSSPGHDERDTVRDASRSLATEVPEHLRVRPIEVTPATMVEWLRPEPVSELEEACMRLRPRRRRDPHEKLANYLDEAREIFIRSA